MLLTGFTLQSQDLALILMNSDYALSLDGSSSPDSLYCPQNARSFLNLGLISSVT